MYATSRFLIVIALGLGLVGAPTVRAEDKKPEKVKPAAEPGKPLIIQIDASKLPPDVLKQLLQLAEPVTKPGTKPTGDKPGVKPGVKPGTKPGVKPGTEAVKPGTKPTGDKPGLKVIGLADAIAIAEKTTQGTATGAVRTGEKDAVRFTVEVEAKGGRTKLVIDGGGNVLDGDGNKGGGEKVKPQK
jgi:hypothetical protein